MVGGVLRVPYDIPKSRTILRRSRYYNKWLEINEQVNCVERYHYNGNYLLLDKFNNQLMYIVQK